MSNLSAKLPKLSKISNSIAHLYQTIHEPIDVIAYSRDGKFRIHQFRWRNYDYKVSEQCLASKGMRGITPVWMFSVLTEDGSYKLRLNTDTLSWWLEEVYSQRS